LTGITKLEISVLFTLVDMLSATVTDTGQITLPEKIQQHLKLNSKSGFEWVATGLILGRDIMNTGCSRQSYDFQS